MGLQTVIKHRNNSLIPNRDMEKMTLGNGSVVGALFIDFEKAFDTIEHQTLGMKLQQAVGISGNCYSLLMNYLADRKQYIDNEGAVSNPFFPLNVVFHKGPY